MSKKSGSTRGTKSSRPYSSLSPEEQKRRCHVQPRMPVVSLHEPGRLRSAHVLALLGISHSSLYSRMNAGTAPRPDGNDGRIYWHTETIRNFLALPAPRSNKL